MEEGLRVASGKLSKWEFEWETRKQGIEVVVSLRTREVVDARGTDITKEVRGFQISKVTTVDNQRS